MRRAAFFTLAIALAGPAAGQAMDHSMMPGMKMPAPKPAAKQKATVKKAAPKRAMKPASASRKRPAKARSATAAPTPAAPACTPEHAAMGHCADAAPSAQANPHAGHEMVATPVVTAVLPSGTALPAGDAPAPAAPPPTYADRIWGADAMRGSRAALRRDHGGGTFSQIMVDIAELQVRDGRDGFRWEGEGWFGGDIDRLVVKTEGEGSFGQRLDDAEVQALYSRAVGPYFNLQGGVRHDIRPLSRTYAAIGVEGLAPYWFEVEAHAFVSTEGDVLARLAASYDQRITQRLILQPRAELNFAAQDGAGLDGAELDLRLRYEIKREFAPYVGISWADADGEESGGLNLVFGVRAWF